MTEHRPALWMVLFLFFPLLLSSQHKHTERCSHDEKMEMAFQLDPAYKKAVLTEDWSASTSYLNKNSQSIVTIPVHVIIVHPPGQAVGTGVNFTLAHVESQIQVLTDDFRRMNADAVNTPSVFPAGDSEIEFCLAAVDPNGNPTDGITRYGTNQNLDSDEFAIKSATGWDRNTYLNFWVGPNLGGLLGWAYLPTTTNLPNATLDGVVVASCSFGGPGFGTCSPYDLGRTGTHEIGHYLGLRHVWGSGGCGNDDGIADTPIQSSSNFGCPNHPSATCNNGGDMFMNYMDYVNDDCMNAFTVGQGTRMNDILNTSRSSLLSAASVVCNSAVPLTLSLLNQTNVSCFAGNDGSISVEGLGGSGAYTYNINGGTAQTTGVFPNLTAGTYTVEVSDGGSSISIQVTITEPQQLIPFVVTQTNVTCSGDGDGVLIVDASGGTNLSGQGYQFNFNGNGFSTNNIFTNLSGGLYTIEAKDDNDCISSLQVLLNEPDPLLSFLTNEIPIDCAGNNNGEVMAQSTGGTPIYLYSLDGSGFDPNPVFSNLTAGNYTLQTVDVNGCENTLNFTMTEPDTLELSLTNQINLDCFGDGDGSIEVSAIGGTTNYQYELNNGGFQNNNLFENLNGGSFEVVVQDANGCTDTVTTDIVEPAELIFEVTSQTNVACFGENTGAVTLYSFGGTGTPTINFNGNQFNTDSVTVGNLAAGIYNVVVLDENNCEVSSTIEISQNDEMNLQLTNTQNIDCNGAGNGEIQVQAIGGAGGYTYFLNGNNQGSNNIFTNLPSGNYLIEVVDSENCVETISVDITEPPVLEAQISQHTNLNCFGENNGSISFTANGGSGTIQYTVGSTTNTSGNFSNLSAGNYSVLIIDENNCSETINFEITQPTELTAQVANSTEVDCFGNNTGSIEVTATGGVQNYQFTNGTETNSTGIFNNLNAGTYDISITDGNNCSTSIQFEVTHPNELIANISTQQNVTCFGESNGSVALQANGGNGSITFTLGNNSNSTGDFSNLTSGNYLVVVMDENNCETTVAVQIDEPSALDVEIESLTEASCAGEEGTVQVIANGGAGNYQYTLGSQTNSTGFFEGLAGGNYSIQVLDNNSCTADISFEVLEPTALNASISQVQNVACYGENTGSVQVNGAGGVGGLTFFLNNQSNTSGLFENLGVGTYTVLVEDGNSCTSEVEVTISEPVQVELSSTQVTQVNCYEGNDGLVNLAGVGGTGTIEFSFGNESNTTGVFENLEAGTYNFLATDENGCTDNLEITITSPPLMEAEVVQVENISCAGSKDGSLEVSASGGVGSFEFSLGNQTNTTGVFEGLEVGTYTIQVVDGNDCVTEVTVEVTEPAAIVFENTQVQNLDCFGDQNGQIQTTATGGMGTLIFSLNNQTNTTGVFENLIAGNYEVVVTDENGCTSTEVISLTQPQIIEPTIDNLSDVICFGENTGLIDLGANGGTGDYQFTLGNETNSDGLFENLPQGVYGVQIEDDNGCTSTVDITINQPSPIVPQAEEIIAIECFGATTGVAQIFANGGTGGYTYALNNNTNADGVFENLSAGTYLFLVMDGNGCEETIELTLDEPSEIIIDILDTQPSGCAGSATGSATIQASNGTGGFTYQMNGATNTSGVFENIAAGIYDVIVTDANGCTQSEEIVIQEDSDIEVESAWIVHVACYGGTSGEINVIAGSGSGDLTFDLNGTMNTSGNFENLSAGMYNVTITDVNNCSLILPFEVIEPLELELEVVATTDVACFGETTGQVDLTASGGVGIYEFSLNNVTNPSGTFENLGAGTYTAEVMDNNGCVQTQTIEITEPPVLTISVSDIINDLGNAEGSATLNGDGGTSPFMYSLDGVNFQTENIFNNLVAGEYTGYIQDANDCLIETTFVIDMETNVFTPNSGVTNLEVFPNPFSNNLYLSIELESAQRFDLQMWTVSGKQVEQRILDLEKGNHQIIVGSQKQLPAGAYILQLKNETGGVGYFKLIKQ